MQVNISMIQALGCAVVTYNMGVWIKNRTPVLRKYNIPSPVVGGLLFSLILSVLASLDIVTVKFDSTLQTQLMLAFFTTIGLMAGVKVAINGGKMLIGFLCACAVLVCCQNVLGMAVAHLMGLKEHYGILAGSVSMMGGLGTAAAFGPYFEQSYGVTGGSVVAITAATYGMVASLVLGGPFGEWLIKRYRIQTPKVVGKPEPKLHIPDELHSDIVSERANEESTYTNELMKASGIVIVCMAVGTVVSGFLGQFITLPAYIGSMIVAAVVRNVGDFSGKFKVEGHGLNAIAEISLTLFVTMAINSLKLHELVHLALPLCVILLVQTVFILFFAWIFIYKIFGRSYDSMMLSVGCVGFGMGATANALANMQAISEKYGFCPNAWLTVSIVGAFLIDLVNALAITWFATL